MVIRREYLERVRKKSFWIGTLVFPLIIVVLVLGPMLLLRLAPEEQKKVAFVDSTGKLLEPMRTELAGKTMKDGRPEFTLEPVNASGSLDQIRKSLEPRVGKREFFAILTIGDDLNAPNNYRIYIKNVG